MALARPVYIRILPTPAHHGPYRNGNDMNTEHLVDVAFDVAIKLAIVAGGIACIAALTGIGAL